MVAGVSGGELELTPVAVGELAGLDERERAAFWRGVEVSRRVNQVVIDSAMFVRGWYRRQVVVVAMNAFLLGASTVAIVALIAGWPK